MDQSCSDLEFFDFNNATEEEIKEIQVILKGPGSNGCVELPWEIPLKENCLEAIPQDEDSNEKSDVLSNSGKVLGRIVGQSLQFTPIETPRSPPVARLPPVETFVAPPTTISHYANTPYFVSRTLPFVRAYHHMGMPIFACPLPSGGETNPMPGPYGQFVPMVPATVGQEKFTGQVDVEQPSQKKRSPSERQTNNRRGKKKPLNAEYSFESENSDNCNDSVASDQPLLVSPPVCTVSSACPTSVPLVPLPVPPSTFGVPGGTLPLHSYPPGLHALPYTQMSGPQAPSAAMYYVPVFNHPYGSYISSPPSAPMVLPVNLRPENETVDGCSEENKVSNNPILPLLVSQPDKDCTLNVPSNCENSAIASEQCATPPAVAKPDLLNPTAKTNTLEGELGTDSSSTSGKTLSDNVDYSISEKVTIAEDNCKCQSGDEDNKNLARDPSRCWADLFKKPSPEVNGLDRQLTTEKGCEKLGSLSYKKVSNGKLYNVPASDNVL